MSAGEFLCRLVQALDDSRIPHMLAGSFASGYHGTPRSTYDIDIVIDPDRGTFDTLLSQLVGGCYLDENVAREALRSRRQFNVIDLATSWKADLIIRKERPFSREEFRRRLPAEILGVQAFVATAEDTILSKLEWAQKSESERQLRDVVGILAVKGEDLDRPYIETWAAELGVTELWKKVSGQPE